MNVSIIVPALNEERNIKTLVECIDMALISHIYEVIFIDDFSTDQTKDVIMELMQIYPVSYYLKKGRKGKSFSLLEGFTHAKYDIVAMLDCDNQYPVSAIPLMLEKIRNGADIVVANRDGQQVSFLRQLFSKSFRHVFVKLLHDLDCDSQAGEKVFRKEVIQQFSFNPSPWTFDLEFLVRARNAGYRIESQDIVFSKRLNGETKVNVFRTSFEIGWSALKLKYLYEK